MSKKLSEVSLTKDRQIKTEAIKLLENGVDHKEVVKQLYHLYGDNNYRKFDDKYGRFCRRNANKYTPTTISKKGSVHMTINNKGETIIETRGCVDQDTMKGMKTPEKILEEHNFPPSLYDVSSYGVNEWDAQTPDGIQTLQSTKLKVRPKQYNPSAVDIATTVQRKIDTVMSSVVSPAPVPAFPVSDNDIIAVWHMGDLHFGRECKVEEVGYDWNEKMATEDVHFMKEQLIEDLKLKKPKKLIVAITGDALNADTIDGSTAHGTPQDMALHCNQLFYSYFQMITEVYDDILRECQIPLELVHVVGNHDTKTMFDMQIALMAYYKNNPNVVCKIEYNHRKYRLFGNSLLCFTHGDCEKSRILDIPSNEVTTVYDKAKYVYIFTEHLHQLKTTTKGKCVAFQTLSPAPPDRWTKNSGYVGSRRGSELFYFDKEKGLHTQRFLYMLHDKKREFVFDVDNDTYVA